MATLVGGTKSGVVTNCLLSLVANGRDGKWCQKFPPYPTIRISATVFSYHGYLVVAGGKVTTINNPEKLSVVEVLKAGTKQWFTAASLPYPACSMTATVCRDNLYLIGGFTEDGETKSVLSCSIPALVQSSQQPNSLMARIKDTLRHSADQGTNAEIWQSSPIPDSPVYHPRIVTFRDELMVVGSTLSVIPSTEVWMYDPTLGSWVKVSEVPTARDWSLVAALPGDQLIVIGGSLQTISRSCYTDTVEIASIC